MVLSVTIKLSFSCIFEFIELVEGLNCLSRLCHPSDCMTPYTSLSSRSTDSGSHFTALRTTLALTPRLKKPMSNWYCGFKHFLGQIRRMRYAYKVARIFQYEFHDVIFCSIGSASEVVWAGRRFRTKFVVGVVWHCPASGAPIPVLCRSVTLCGRVKSHHRRTCTYNYKVLILFQKYGLIYSIHFHCDISFVVVNK